MDMVTLIFGIWWHYLLYISCWHSIKWLVGSNEERSRTSTTMIKLGVSNSTGKFDSCSEDPDGGSHGGVNLSLSEASLAWHGGDTSTEHDSGASTMMASTSNTSNR